MSSAEFPLTLLLQVQNDMSGGIQAANSDVQQLTSNVENAGNATSNLESRVQSSRGSFLQFGLGVAAAASGVLNLVRQYHNLQKAQRLVENSENKVTNATKAYNKAVHEHGKNSEEAKKAARGLANAENMLENKQVSLNDRMMDFAFSIGPSIIGVVAGLAQTFDILGGKMGGTRGIGMGMLKFAGVLAVVGFAVVAFKNNLFGFRDAVNGIGVALGQAIPGLVPFLNALKDVAIVLGLMPGNAKEAQKELKKFGGGIIEWGKQVWSTVEKIFKKLMSGDILGAIKIAKDAIVNAIPGLKQQIQKFLKNPIKTTVDVIVGIANAAWDFLKGIKVGKYSLDQIVTGLGILFANEVNNGGNPVDAGIKVYTHLVDAFMDALLPADVQKVYDAFTKEWDKTKGQNAAKIAINVIATKINDLPPLDTTTLGSFTQSVANLFKAIPPVSVSPPLALAALLVPPDAGEKIDKWVKDTFTLANFSAAINAIGNTLMTVGKTVVAWIFAGLTTFSKSSLDPLIANALKTLFDPNAWTSALSTISSTLMGIGTAIWDGIFGKNATPQDAASKAKTVATNMVTMLGNGFKQLVSTDWADVGSKIWTGIVGWFETNLPQSTEEFKKIITAIGTGLGNAITSAPGLLADFAKKFLDQIWKNITTGGLDFDPTTPISLNVPNAIVTPQTVMVSMPDASGGAFEWANKGAQGSWNFPISSATVQPQTLFVDFSKAKVTGVTSGGNNSAENEQNGVDSLFLTDAGKFATLFAGIEQAATKAAQTVSNVFGVAISVVSTGFSGLAATVSAVMNSFGANANSGASQITSAMSRVFTQVSAGMSSLASTWSAVCNSFGANAKSGANQIISAMKQAQSATVAAFKAMAAASKAAFAAIVSGAKSATSAMKSATSAANSLVSALKKVESAAKKAAAAEAKVGSKATGGTMATGGILSAARGRMFTTAGEQMIKIGDNPGGRETVAFIPHNNPGPTLDKIGRMFAGTQFQGSVTKSLGRLSGGNGGCVINVYLDGEQIRGKIVKMISKHQGGFK